MTEEKDFIEKRLDKVLNAKGIQYSGLSLVSVVLKPQHIDYLADNLPEHRSIPALDLQGNSLDDEAIPALKRLLAKMPDLKSLHIGYNHFTADGLSALKEEMGRIWEVDVTSNPLGEKGGKVLSEVVESSPRLHALVAANCSLGDAGSTQLADAVTKSENLYHINLAHNDATPETNRRLLNQMVRENRSLTRITVDYDAVENNTGLHKALLETPSRNLSTINFVMPGANPTVNSASITFSRLEINRQKSTQLRSKVRGDWSIMSGDDLREVERHHHAIFDPMLTNLIEHRMKGYDAFVDALPKLPAMGAGFTDKLFRTDEKGFAPLDNPKLLTVQETDAFLRAIPRDAAFLTKKTDKGSGVLDVLAQHYPAEKLMEICKESGTYLGKNLLLDHSGKASPLFLTLMDKKDIGAVFTLDNWYGKSQGELQKVYAVLPEAAKKDVPYFALLQQMKVPSLKQGVGR
ncbi:MAG: hypothetical protein FJX23_01220 [Alphaproteobacteria bacterium]|nr:hypothetical protein [Alphaproteobacteria bacterium]